MDPTKLLEADHRTAEDLFAKIEKAEPAQRRALVDELATALEAHMQLEEQVVYPAMQPVTGPEDVQEGVTEHELARKALTEMIALAPDEPGFGAALDSVKAGIEHHVKDEEEKVFPKLRSDGRDVLEQMATPFMQKRLELGLPMDATALVVASTKDELLQEAKAAEVSGAASMTKDELAQALAGKMAAS